MEKIGIEIGFTYTRFQIYGVNNNISDPIGKLALLLVVGNATNALQLPIYFQVLDILSYCKIIFGWS